MNIAINTRFLLKNKLEGIGRVNYEYATRLAAMHPEHTFYFLFDRPFHPDFIASPNIKPIVVYPPARHPWLWYMWFELTVPYILKKIKADVFLSPDGYCSLRTKVPTVMIVHDIAFKHFPDDLKKNAATYYNNYMPRFVERAERIVCVSDYTRADVLKHYSVNSDKVVTIHNGLNTVFEKPTAENTAKVLQQYGISGKYLLYVGAIHPRKNIQRLVQAFEKYKANGGAEKLVLAGRKAWKNEELDNYINQSICKNDILFTGMLTNSELSVLYHSADCSIYVPYFEGFGFPILEAQLCGTPVITSSVTSMPEVGADSVQYADPYSVESIAAAIGNVLGNDTLKSELRNKGFENIKRFSWQKSSEALWKEISKLAAVN